MANFQVTGKSAIASVDFAADLLLIYDFSASQLKNTTVNTLLNVTSQPASINDVQTLTNKTLGITNTVTLLDTLFTLQDNSDNTKQAKFELSGITTGTTRTYTLPNASSTLVDLSTLQTLTNKTLTSPTINTATITNPTMTVDTIAEFTSTNGVVIDGVKLKDGALATNNSVVTSNITDTAVTPAKLQTGTGASWSWQDWTPTLTNLSGGAITFAKYIQMGKTVHFRFKYTLAGAGVAGAVAFTLPVTAAFGSVSNNESANASVLLTDTGTASYLGATWFNSTTSLGILALNAAGTYLIYSNLSSTIPHTWANTDVIYVAGTYEAA